MPIQIVCITPPAPFNYCSRIKDYFSEDRSVEVSRIGPNWCPGNGLLRYDGIIISGSSAHVYQNNDWQENLTTQVETAINRGTPVLGVCFGHQLLAKMLGGVVQPMETPELGYKPVYFRHKEASTGFLADVPPVATPFEWHWDTVTHLPKETTVLSYNETGIQAFKSQQYPVYGIQFHPEVDVELAVRAFNDAAEDEEIDEAVVTITSSRLESASQLLKIYENFVKQVMAT